MGSTNRAELYACCKYDSPFGAITLAAGEDGLKGLWFDGQRYFGASLDAPMEPRENGHLQEACTWLDEYFAGEKPSISRLTLAPIGSAYRQVVWQLLREIPYGQVRTYGEIAQEAALRMGKDQGSARAVGGAVGHNPISIIVPCHRVVGTGGNLTGFGGGIARKLQLLQHEGMDCSGFYVPARSTAP
ncbi:MAG: methylated-DNA--[Eggerthellaceae bacterium]|nr:methylated-DNA--[protein]-cysteine S-methyltransferase [Eggerthellaceae bacterium]